MENSEKTLKLETDWGWNFHQIAQKAVEIAAREGMTVEFKFNGLTCLVVATTDPALLFRDYQNAYKMGWETVGPDCPVEYPVDVQATLDRRTKEEAEKDAIRTTEYAKKDRAEKEKFEQKTVGIELEITDQAAFDDWKGKNTDDYGACIFEYAESWAKLMQYEMGRGKRLTDVAKDASFELGYLGITGFMYGVAVKILALYWKHGEELRLWHNGEYKHTGDGVVNPALLTISA